MGEIFNKATDAQIGALLIALRLKGESVSEIAGLARKMRDSAVRIHPRVNGTLVDTCGTGGDAANTINVSTAAAIVSAACGVPVAKHGNYASKLEVRQRQRSIRAGRQHQPRSGSGTGHDRAPGNRIYAGAHLSSRHEAGGAHPTRAGIAHCLQYPGAAHQSGGSKAQVMGVYDPGLCEKLASVFLMLGTDRAMVVHGKWHG